MARRAQGISTAILRGIFYIPVSLEIIEKYSKYKSLSKSLVEARRTGVIPEDWIVDESIEIIDIYDLYFKPWEKNTRLPDWLEELPEEYIKAILRWHNQPKYVEIWLEKNAM